MRLLLVGALVVGSTLGPPPPPPPPPPADGGRTHVVEIRGFGFSPARLEVAPGDTVVWLNRDAAPHTATAADGAWDSTELASGARWRLVPAAPGRVPYLCAYHPTMRGELIVRASERHPRDPEVES